MHIMSRLETRTKEFNVYASEDWVNQKSRNESNKYEMYWSFPDLA